MYFSLPFRQSQVGGSVFQYILVLSQQHTNINADGNVVWWTVNGEFSDFMSRITMKSQKIQNEISNIFHVT